jgi:hypothetical protein
VNVEAIVALVGVVIIFITTVVIFTKFVVKKVPRRHLKTKKFQFKWKELQAYCADKATWPDALTAADNLLTEALKKRHMKGKNTGEMLVSAQKLFTDNDGVWFGHKLCRKIQEDPELKLKEADVKEALIGIRQALKDLGALPAQSKKAQNG